MTETYVVFTVDDVGMQKPEPCAELLDFLAVHDVPATLFTVPAWRGKSLEKRRRWLELLDRAIDHGHEIQHHGWTHAAFEFGVPPPFMNLAEASSTSRRWRRSAAPVSAGHTHDALVAKLEQGRTVFHKTLGYAPLGFRSPCLASCDNLHGALRAVGFTWCSNEVINPTGWRHINGDHDAVGGWRAEVPPHPYRHPSGLVELPIHSEYTWYLSEADIERQFQLARSDFDRSRQVGGVFVALGHHYAMTGQWAAGLRVYERLFDHMRQHSDVRFVTLSRLMDPTGTVLKEVASAPRPR